MMHGRENIKFTMYVLNHLSFHYALNKTQDYQNQLLFKHRTTVWFSSFNTSWEKQMNVFCR